ncbi:MAG: MmgE/PrpD family protein [Alphaproteobacteria bacterium]|nr:MmgE/PrpD family protein [Alphaproteobacteria bacterium]
MSAAYLDRFAEFICQTRYDDLTPSAVHAGKRVLLDNLGAIMRGSEEPENMKLSTLSRRDPGGRNAATLLAAGFPRTETSIAALINGVQACSVELDDGYRYATAHAGANVVPGILAAAEALGSSGRDLLLAVILGYEACSRGALALRTPKFVTIGHGLFAVLGTAVGVAKLKGYSAGQMREVINVATSLGHLSSYRVLLQGANVRNFLNGAGARDGILATELVECGYLGLLDGPATSYGLLGPFEPERMIDKLGAPYCIEQNYHKQYACNGNFDASVESTLRLRKAHGIRPADIRRIQVDIYAPYHTLDTARPRSTLGAKFSLRYAVAAVAVLGHANHEAFTAEARANTDIQRVAEVTQLREDAELAKRIPAIRPARITIELADGRTVSDMTEDPRGHYLNPFTDDELKAKFALLAGRYMVPAGVAAVTEMVMAIDGAGAAADLTAAMRSHAR